MSTFEDYKKDFPENCQIRGLAPHPLISGGCGVEVTIDISEKCSQAFEAGLREGLSRRSKLYLKRCSLLRRRAKKEKKNDRL